MGCHFTIKTDHYSLKFFLKQKLVTCPQQHWVSKLLGFDFLVDYRSDALNTIADALSHCHVETRELYVISPPTVAWFDKVQQEIEENSNLMALWHLIEDGEAESHWSVHKGLILNKR